MKPDGRGVADQLWAAYAGERTRDARDELVLHYSPLVRHVAARLAATLPSDVDAADLASDGLFGLIDAVDRFDPERGVRFEAYAITRIRGAMLDALRLRDWVPRSIRARDRAIEAARIRLEADRERPPSDEDVAEAVGITVDQLRDVQSRSRSGPVALDDVLADLLVEPDSAPWFAMEVEDTRQALIAAVNRLPDREKLVLTLYYYEGLTLREIGGVLGVTESRVCQLHSRAVHQLRARLGAEQNRR